MVNWQTAKSDIEAEIKKYLLTLLKPTDPPLKKMLPVWTMTHGSNLRLSEFGFKYYSHLHTPFKMEAELVMTGNRLIQLVRVMDNSPWYYERKFTPGQSRTHGNMKHIIYHWDDAKNVSWVLGGQDWNTWVAMSS